MSARFLLSLLAALTLVLTACSGDGGGGKSGSSAGADAAWEAAAAKVKVPVNRPFFGELDPDRGWRTSGSTPQPVLSLPFTEGVLLERQLDQPVDDQGIHYYERDGKRFDHPVALAQYALAKLDQANTSGSKKAMAAAKANANRLLDVAERAEGGLYFPYPFDFPLGGRERQTIQAPWWSAMAQGEALSLFVRLHEVTGAKKWKHAADRTFATLDDRGPRDKPWTVFVDKHGYLWFEEYAGDTKPMLVLNGHMFAMFGIYEYERLTGSPKAARLFDAGATTLREYLPSFRERGEISYYCARLPFCHRPLWQNEKYHGIVERQMRYIADMTDDRWFTQQANKFARDHDGWPLPVEYQ